MGTQPCRLCIVNDATLCVDCSNAKLELERNSCAKLDWFNDAARKEINRIFIESERLQSASRPVEEGPAKKTSTGAGTIHQVPRSLSPSPSSSPSPSINGKLQDAKVPSELPIASIDSIKVLSQQLVRLQVVNQKVKIMGIERTTDSLERRIKSTRQHVEALRQRLEKERESIHKAKKVIELQRIKKINLIDSERDFTRTKSERVKRQATRLQIKHYHTLMEMSFSTYVGKSYISKLKAGKLLFNKQPIIPLDKFFEYNNRIEQLNNFLENLIILQRKILNVFDDGVVRMPYLVELEKLIPTSKFYDIVHSKEVQMLGFDDGDGEEEEEKSGGKLNGEEMSKQEKNRPGRSNEKVINLGDALMLPLSSKTINNQRRLSLNPGAVSTGIPEPISSANTTDKSNTESTPASPSPPQMQRTNKLLNGKKVVIIPHKILTKPFTKLTPKEYLKFLQIVVKILVNFKSFFSLIRPLSETYDLEKILTHVSTLGSYFERKLEDQPLSSSPYETTTQEESSSVVSTVALSGKKSMKNFYSKIFGAESPLNIQSVGTGEVGGGDTGGIFGNVSEMGQSVESPAKSVINPTDNMKVTIQRVYGIIVGGVKKDKVAASKVHLEDWDVISKML
ncbi:hypothetical protein CAAN1_02S07250 [[Candida] anglica]|uniref:Autophagy-related protein 14 n=1 Tax=[Candida] anglica TaxID=148631 RepID=A0ABP0EFL6_9ASCO